VTSAEILSCRSGSPITMVNVTAARDTRLTFAPRSLVVVGGLPGSGKTTLLERLGAIPGAVVLDSADVMRAWRRLPLPYRILRPLVHLEHHARIGGALLLRPRDGVVVHETATRGAARRWMLALARLSRRPAHLLLLDVDPGTARAGQLARGRVVPAASQRRHAARWLALREDAARGVLPGEDWASVRLLDRAGAGTLRTVSLERRSAAALLHRPRVAG
jgi:predicted kinase